jgi:hypothetical protein
MIHSTLTAYSTHLNARGLSHSGEEGVYNVLKLLNDELALAMKLMGAVQISVSAVVQCCCVSM